MFSFAKFYGPFQVCYLGVRSKGWSKSSACCVPKPQDGGGPIPAFSGKCVSWPLFNLLKFYLHLKSWFCHQASKGLQIRLNGHIDSSWYNDKYCPPLPVEMAQWPLTAPRDYNILFLPFPHDSRFIDLFFLQEMKLVCFIVLVFWLVQCLNDQSWKF